jgi:hypothetical protein
MRGYATRGVYSERLCRRSADRLLRSELLHCLLRQGRGRRQCRRRFGCAEAGALKNAAAMPGLCIHIQIRYAVRVHTVVMDIIIFRRQGNRPQTTFTSIASAKNSSESLVHSISFAYM